MVTIRLFLATGFLLCSTAVAGDNEFTRPSLKGIQGVHVVVENLDPTEEEAGLTVADLQTDVELKLRLAGIPVLSKQEMVAVPGMPDLYVTVNVNSSTTRDLWPYAIEIQFQQNVTLVRNPQTLILGATTWSTGAATGSVLKQNVRRLREELKDLVDKFVNAYLAVNPKK